MKQIYFKGYYGNQNLGDDIFTITAEYICNNYWSNYKPVFIGQSLPKLSTDSKAISVKYNHTRRLYELLLLLKSSNMIYFGGSLFTNGGRTIKDLKYLIRKNKYLQKKTIIFGVSLGPFLNVEDYKSTKDLLEKIKYRGVRDYSSSKILDSMKIYDKSRFTFDIAILLSDVYPDLIKRTKKNEGITIGISLTRNESEFGRNQEAEKQREENLKETIHALLESNKLINKLMFIEFNGNKINGDSKITDEFIDIFKDKIETQKISYTRNTKHMLDSISECDFMLGTRLHSGIIAYSLEIPFILIEYHSKCTEFLNTINHDYRFDVNNYKSNVEKINWLIQRLN